MAFYGMSVIMSIKCIKLNFNFKMKGINSVANFKPKLYHTEQTLHFKYNNPCLTLQSYVEVPIFKDVNLFSPGFKSLLAAEDLFSPKSEHQISLISKTIDFEKFPNPNLPEVALIGASNAGKSSLIKAILQNVPDIRVKTSKKPGHTKSINFFQVGSKLRLVDMPGYGERQPRWFEDIVFPFFQSSRNLVKIFLIVDGKVGLEESSEDMLKLLEEFKRPYCTVLNKIDKTSDSVRLRNLLHLQNFIRDNRLLYCHSHPFMLSSLTYEGLAYFLAFLGHITGNININE